MPGCAFSSPRDWFHTALLGLGVIREAAVAAFNNGSVLLGLFYGYLPFMIAAALPTLNGSIRRALSRRRPRPVPLPALLLVVVPLAGPAFAQPRSGVFIPRGRLSYTDCSAVAKPSC